MSGLGSLVVSLIAETAQFTSSLDRAAYAADKRMGDIKKSADQVAGAVGSIDGKLESVGVSLRALVGVGAAGGFGFLVKSSIDALAALDDLAEQAGTTVETLSGMEPAAKMAGIGVDQVATMTNKLAKSLSEANDRTSPQARALEALGISSARAAQMLKDPGVAMLELAKAQTEFESGGGKSVALMTLLGKSGAEAAPFLEKLAETGIVAGRATSEQAAAAEKLSDSLALLRLKSEDVGRTMASALLPHLQGIVNAFDAMNSQKTESLGFWDAVGEAMRVASLGAATIWTAIKNVAVDLGTVWSIAMDIVQNGGKNIGAISDARDASINKNTDSLVAFYDQVAQGSRVLTQTAAAETEAANSAKAHAGARGQVTFALGEANKAGDSFLKGLREQSETFGKTEAQTQAYKAALLGVSAAAAPLIAKIEELKNTEARRNDAMKAHISTMQKVEETTLQMEKLHASANNSARETIENIQFETSLIGMNDAARTKSIALRNLEKSAVGMSADELARYRDELSKALDDNAARQKMIDTANATRQAWEDAAKSIQTAIEDALMNGFRKGGDFGKTIKDALTAMFKTLILRPILAPISAGMSMMPGAAGAATPGGAASAVAGGFNPLSGLSSVVSTFTSSIDTIGMFAADFGQLLGQGVGLFEAGGMALGAAGGFASMFAAVVPWAALAMIAVPLILDAFDSGPAQRTADFRSNGTGYNPNYSGTSKFGSFGIAADKWFSDSEMGPALKGLISTVKGLDDAVAGIVGTDLTAQIAEALKGSQNYGFGTEHTDLNASGAIGQILRDRYATVLAVVDKRFGDLVQTFAGTGEELGKFVLSLATLSSALKSVPTEIGSKLIAGLDGTQAGAETAAKFAAAYAALVDVMNSDPLDDALQSVAASSGGAFDAFMRASSALDEMVAASDGSAASVEQLASATRSYYAAQVQLLAQLDQVRAAITGPGGMFANTVRSLTMKTLDDPAKYEFLQNESATLRDQLLKESDPQKIRELADKINADINEAFGLLSADEQVKQLDAFKERIATLSAQVDERIGAVKGGITETAGELLKKVQTAFNEAIDKFAASATTIENAATTAATTAEIPVQVDVSFTANVPGAVEVNQG